MKKTTKIAALTASSLLILGVATGVLVGQARVETAPALAQAPAHSPSVDTQPAAQPGSLLDARYSFRVVAQRIIPSVVEINVTEMVSQPAPRFGFGAQQSVPVSALGSGIIVRHTGNDYYVLTNNHVVDNATDLSVRLNDQRTFPGTVLGKDPTKDLAIVSFRTAEQIPVAALGDSNSLQVGDLVLAVGNPFGFESTVTMGIVSALGRRGPTADPGATSASYIQTDAAINEGNSGGALVNIKGEVIGINAWIAAPTGGNVGLGFAIPINDAKAEVRDLITVG